ncbi:hypothetical protein C1M51_02000 [Methylibium sp. Pch-M]|nr:hypothetical protein C1M51_02000 [Methylibium sp. Pch-M]
MIMRAAAKASLSADGKSVANGDVARIADIHISSVSVCNPFWVDIGLMSRDGLKLMPHAAVFEYDQAAEWNAEKAPLKLARVFEGTWFAKAILPRLALRSMTRAEVLEVLAEECRAPKEFQPQLELLIEYMRLVGVIIVDGSNVTRAKAEAPSTPPLPPPAPAVQAGGESKIVQPPHQADNMERFSIYLPGKAKVTVEIPKDIDKDDWIMVADHLAGYIRRWKGWRPTPALKDATDDDNDVSANNPSGVPK